MRPPCPGNRLGEYKSAIAVYQVFSKAVDLKGIGQARILISYDNEEFPGSPAYFATDQIRWEGTRNPRYDQSSGSFTKNWDTTKVGLERTLAKINDLPCVIDDSKKADPRRIEQFIYLLVNGQGRMRGSRTGLAESFNWRTVGISSGEAPITSYAVSSGAKARVIPVKGSPFGRTNADTRRVVDGLNRVLRGNYGHAGLLWVKWLIDHKSEWTNWKERYDEIRQRFASTSGAAGRLADACALISLTGELVHKALELGWEHSDPLGQLWESIAEGFDEIDVGFRALREVYELTVGNPGRFCCKGRLPVSENCFGAWDYEDEHWVSLNLIPSVLKQKLTDMGYRYEEIIENWKEKGWLVLDHRGDNPRHSMGKSRTRLISIHRAAIVAVAGEEISLIDHDSPIYRALNDMDPWSGSPPRCC